MEHTNKFDRIRNEIEKKYEKNVKVTFNESISKIKGRYATTELFNILKELNQLNIGQNIKLKFEYRSDAREYANSIRYHIKKEKIARIRVMLQLKSIYLLREKPEETIKSTSKRGIK